MRILSSVASIDEYLDRSSRHKVFSSVDKLQKKILVGGGYQY